MNSSLFGNNNNQLPTSNTGSLFGNNNNNNQTSSIFGSNNNQQTGQTSSLFGSNNNNNNQTSSLFGSNNNQQQTSTTNSLFGNHNNNNNQQTNNSSLFGNHNNNNQPSSSSSLFGSNNNNNQTSSLFGSTNNQNQPTSLFGSTNNQTSSLFNSNTQTQPSSLFSSTTQPNLNSSSTSNSLIGNQSLSNSIQIKIKHQISIEEKILKVYQAWNLNDPNCEFHYFFYNLVQPDQIHLYQRHPLSQNERKWELAKRLNPDPNRMIPVLAIGFQDLIKRQEVQINHANLHLIKLIEFSNKLNEIIKKLTLIITPKLHKLKTNQSLLTNRLINLIIKLPINQLSSSSSIEEELEEKHQLFLNLVFQISIKLQKIGGKSKVSELWSNLSFLKNSFGSTTSTITSSGNGGGDSNKDGNGRWTLTDDREIKKVLQVLRNQQIGIDHLMNVLRNDLEHYKFMANAFQIEN